MTRALFAILVALCMAAGCAVLVPGARADEAARLAWIHANARNCCDHRDCKPAQVAMTFTGWKVEGADNVVPFAQVIRWPFSGPYACVIGRHARCLLMDAGG